MGIEAIIGAERQRYVEYYAETKSTILVDDKNAVGELLLSINNEAIPYLYRYVRVDIISKETDGSPRISEILIDADKHFEPKGFNFGAFQVEVYPFAWCRIQVLFDKPPTNVGQIEGWITRWLDVEGRGDANADGLSGAVHSFSQIETDGSWWFLTADFGTAPADTLVEFIELLATQGMSRIVLKAG